MSSPLQQQRLLFHPKVPVLLQNLSNLILVPESTPTPIAESLCKIFPNTHALPAWHAEKEKGARRPLRVGALFSGGQAAGGHNVLSGLFDGLRQIHAECHLIGFLDGPSGLIDNKTIELSQSAIDGVRNVGGFDLIGSGRTKIETPEQFLAAAHTAQAHQLDCIVVIGGDDSNTNAAYLAEYFLQNQISTRVIGVPKTIDGDLRSQDIEISFGFDSACKTYSELIGNIARDAMSAKKYYHIIKLMGRSASHIALECALATCPNLTLIGEEKLSFAEVIRQIVDLIIERKKNGKEYGVILLPEGLIEFVPEFKNLIEALSQNKTAQNLLEPHRSFFNSLSEKIQQQLLFDRDPHGNIQISQIETEQLVLDFVKKELKKLDVKLNAQGHFFGYEGRSCFPSNFDATYCYSLGLFASLAARDKITGAILAIKNLQKAVAQWELKAIPLVQMMGFEMRAGKEKPVIAKTPVDLQGRAYRHFAKKRSEWRINDFYQMPGPIQFFGPSELTDSIPISLSLS